MSDADELTNIVLWVPMGIAILPVIVTVLLLVSPFWLVIKVAQRLTAHKEA